VRCPTLIAWSVHDDLEDLWGDPVAIWRGWADDVRGATIDSGHHMAEEAPEQLAAVLVGFFSAPASSS
jgi:haloacetate dehalogenase